MFKKVWGYASLLGLMLLCVNAYADAVSFTFGGTATTWNGTPFPNGNTSYLSAVFTDVSPDYVDLILTPHLPIGGPMNADIDDIAFNMLPFITDLTATGPSGFKYSVASDGEKISSYKKLDILLDEGQGYAHSILEGTTPITIHLHGTIPQALTASVFNATNSAGQYAVAKIQTASGSYESTSNGPPSVLVFAPPPVLAPLPPPVIAGTSLLSLLAIRQLRRLKIA